MTSAHSPLVVPNLNKRFGSVRALRDVSFALQPGSITGLLGPNGAGKTTLIRICAGLLRQDSGEVFIHRLSQSPWNLATRALIGVVSADAPPAGELTVLETLRVRAVLCGLHGAALREACTSAVRHYGLEHVLTRRVSALSTGMRRRVAIACAMLHAPRLLLLDEPTVGLDPDARTHLWECLRDLANAGEAMDVKSIEDVHRGTETLAKSIPNFRGGPEISGNTVNGLTINGGEDTFAGCHETRRLIECDDGDQSGDARGSTRSFAVWLARKQTSQLGKKIYCKLAKGNKSCQGAARGLCSKKHGYRLVQSQVLEGCVLAARVHRG